MSGSTDAALWIGGPSAVGKTTVARRLARRHGLRWYNADAHTWDHRDRALAAGDPAAARWEAMTPEERWVETSPEEMLELSLNLARWRMVAEDVAALPRSPLVVAEGTTVLPDLVESGIADRSRALWLRPSPELQRARLESTHAKVQPAAARANVVELSLLTAAEIERRAVESGVAMLRLDGSETVPTVVAAVEDLFAEALADGPRAETRGERRALLRYANDAVASQCIAYLARPWASGDPETVVREFVCECDDPECDEAVEVSVAAYVRAARAEAGSVTADGHEKEQPPTARI